jgi:hypothetical protein
MFNKGLTMIGSFEVRAQAPCTFFRRASTRPSPPSGTITGLFLVMAVCAVTTCTLTAQTAASSGKPTVGSPAATTGAAKPLASDTPTHSQPPLMPRRAALFYDSVWGVDSLSVKVAESGELIRFSWRVLDPAKAKTLSDKKLDPALIAPASHVKLVIPSLEKVGQLRQSSTPEAGRSYWMAFSNPGRVVKRGDRVDISIGPFRAEGITVE